MRRVLELCAALAMLVVAGGSFALGGPAYTEPPSDAGDRKSSAADASAFIGAGTISGTLSGTGMVLGLPDFEDMYVINIAAPGVWQASTSPAAGNGRGFAEFDSVLWLFRFSDERGLLANDDAFPPPLAGGSRLTAAATDGTPLIIDAPGLYLLAISPRGRVPVDANGTALFNFGSPTEISGPDGSQLPLAGWAGSPDAMLSGDYTIEIIPSPGSGAFALGVGLAFMRRRRATRV